MKRLTILILVTSFVAGSVWLWNDNQFSDQLKDYIENGEINTLEARFTAEQIMSQNKKDLIGESNRTYQEPTLKFYPYILIDAKYIGQDKKTAEGSVLWSLVDGEMVLDTSSWEKTHGFEDAINANASVTDFKVMNALAKYDGSLNREKLQRELNVESETLDKYLESAKEKHLIIQKNGEIALHFDRPKIMVLPSTKMNHWVVTKPYDQTQRVSRAYSKSQIERVAKAAFGNEFKIRNTSEVYLPVYGISVLNPDGSVFTSYWNALNGKRI